MNSSKFKFTNNLLKASNSDNIDNAINEWCNIYEEKRNKLDGLCICGRKVKNKRNQSGKIKRMETSSIFKS